MRLIELHVAAGPVPPTQVTLGHGGVLLGRARGCAVRLADPAIEAHHARLAVDRSGTLTVTQLAGRAPIVVDGEPVGPSSVAVTRWLELGATRLAIGRPPASRVDGVIGGVIGVVDASDTPVVMPAHTGPVGIAFDERCVEHAAMAAAIRSALGAMAVRIAPPGSPELDACTSLIELGARWRARVTLDLAHPLDIVRVHLRNGRVRVDP